MAAKLELPTSTPHDVVVDTKMDAILHKGTLDSGVHPVDGVLAAAPAKDMKEKAPQAVTGVKGKMAGFKTPWNGKSADGGPFGERRRARPPLLRGGAVRAAAVGGEATDGGAAAGVLPIDAKMSSGGGCDAGLAIATAACFTTPDAVASAFITVTAESWAAWERHRADHMLPQSAPCHTPSGRPCSFMRLLPRHEALSKDPNADGAKPPGGCTIPIAMHYYKNGAGNNVEAYLVIIPETREKLALVAKELLEFGLRSLTIVDMGGDSVTGSIETKNMDALTKALAAHVRRLQPALPVYDYVFAPGVDGESTPEQMEQALATSDTYLCHCSLKDLEPGSKMYRWLLDRSDCLLPTRTISQMLDAWDCVASTYTVKRVYPAPREVVLPTPRLRTLVVLFHNMNDPRYFPALLALARSRFAGFAGANARKDIRARIDMIYAAGQLALAQRGGKPFATFAEFVAHCKGQGAPLSFRDIIFSIAHDFVLSPDYTPFRLPALRKPGQRRGDKEAKVTEDQLDWVISMNQVATAKAADNTDHKHAHTASMIGIDPNVKTPDGREHQLHIFAVPLKPFADRVGMGDVAINAALASPNKKLAAVFRDLDARVRQYVGDLWGDETAQRMKVHLLPENTQDWLHVHIIIVPPGRHLGHAYYELAPRNMPIDLFIALLDGEGATEDELSQIMCVAMIGELRLDGITPSEEYVDEKPP